MKKVFNILLIVAVIFSVSATFSGCKDDDNDGNSTEKLSDYLAGTYTGKVLTVKDGTIDATMRVTATGDNSIKAEFVGTAPSGVPASVTSNLRVLDSNTIGSTAVNVVNILYYKDNQNLTLQNVELGTGTYSFQGSKINN